jgi:hypothetical protein
MAYTGSKFGFQVFCNGLLLTALMSYSKVCFQPACVMVKYWRVSAFSFSLRVFVCRLFVNEYSSFGCDRPTHLKVLLTVTQLCAINIFKSLRLPVTNNAHLPLNRLLRLLLNNSEVLGESAFQIV